MKNERWIQVSLEGPEMGRKLRNALSISYRLHNWAIGLLREHWLESMQVLTVNEMQPMMTYWMREQGIGEQVQRYSLDVALSRTILYFNNELRVVVSGVAGIADGLAVAVSLPEPVAEKDWNKVDIQSRTVWRRYLEDYGRLTSHFGTIFLEGDWPAEIRGYAKDLGVKTEILPHLWNSVTLKEGTILDDSVDEDMELWLMRFNFFKPESVAAKKRTKKGRLYDEE